MLLEQWNEHQSAGRRDFEFASSVAAYPLLAAADLEQPAVAAHVPFEVETEGAEGAVEGHAEAVALGVQLGDGNGIEIGNCGIRAGLDGPILNRALPSDALNLPQVQRHERFAIAAIEVAFPGDGKTKGRGWNLEQDHAASGFREFVDLNEGELVARLAWQPRA